MAKLFLNEIGSQIKRQSEIVGGNAIFSSLKQNTVYEARIKNTSLFNSTPQNEEFLFLKNNPISINDTMQQVTTTTSTINLSWTKYPNYASIKLWNKMKEVIRSHNGDYINYNTITLFGPSDSIADKYVGAILTQDGKVVCPPFSATQPVIIDPDTLTVTKFGTAESGTRKYFGGILLPDGNILCIPWYATRFAIIDPINLTFTKVGPTFSGNQFYEGGQLLPNGKILMVPYTSTTKCILFDPINYTYEAFGDAFSGEQKWNCPILYEENKAVATPLYADRPIKIDLVTNLVTKFAIADSSNLKYSGSCLLVDGTIFIEPFNKTQPAIINPINGTLTPFGASGTLNNGRFNGSTLLPDGRVLMTPHGSEKAAIIDTNTNDITLINLPVSVSPNYSGSCLLPDGRVIFAPRTAKQFAILSASDDDYGELPNLDVCLSAYLNKY